MNEEKIKQIQNELMKEIDNESKIENEIIDSAENAAAHLIMSPKVTIEIDNKPYMIAYKLFNLPKGGQKIFMLATNLNLYKITPEKYKPYTIQVIVDSKYTLKENLKASVEAFIRHVTGRIKPEILCEEEKVNVVKK